jgi:hypothetical protein
MPAFATPLVFVIFNRPAETRRVFSRLRELRPRRLHVIADGPRADRPEEAARCAETRDVIEEMLDWDCAVTRDFSETNLGCGRRLATGLTRAFAELGEAIVVEDDVLPHPDFFPFCARLLAQYRGEPRVHAINGFNPLGRYAPRGGNYVPSVFNSIWGWASWQRAWRDYSFAPTDWDDPAVRAAIERFVRLPLIAQHLDQHVAAIRAGDLDTWDFQWWLAQLRAERVSLVSSVNFIENVGFNSAGTHTVEPRPFLRGLRPHTAEPAPRERSIAEPDHVFDRLYIDVVLTASPAKVAAARFAAGAPFTHPLIARALR